MRYKAAGPELDEEDEDGDEEGDPYPLRIEVFSGYEDVCISPLAVGQKVGFSFRGPEKIIEAEKNV